MLRRRLSSRRSVAMVVALAFLVVFMAIGAVVAAITTSDHLASKKLVHDAQADLASFAGADEALAYLNGISGPLETAVTARDSASPVAPRSGMVDRACFTWSLAALDEGAGEVTVYSDGVMPGVITTSGCGSLSEDGAPVRSSMSARLALGADGSWRVVSRKVTHADEVADGEQSELLPDPPTIQITQSPGPLSGDADVSFGFMTTGMDQNATIMCELDPGDQAVPCDAAGTIAGPGPLTGMAPGREYTLTATVNNSAGEASATHTWIYAPVVPVVNQLPSGPADSEEVYYDTSGSGAGPYWHFRYEQATDRWWFLGGPPINDNGAGTFTTTGSYTVTPMTITGDPNAAAKLNVPLSGQWDVAYAGSAYFGTSGQSSNDVRLIPVLDGTDYSPNTPHAAAAYPGLGYSNAHDGTARFSANAGQVLDLEVVSSAGGQRIDFWDMRLQLTPVWVQGQGGPTHGVVTGVPRVTALPAGAADGAEVAYDTGQGAWWRLRYDEAAARWSALGGAPIHAKQFQASNVTTPSTSYVSGQIPGISASIPLQGSWDVTYSASAYLRSTGALPDARILPAFGSAASGELREVLGANGFSAAGHMAPYSGLVRAESAGPTTLNLRMETSAGAKLFDVYGMTVMAMPVWVKGTGGSATPALTRASDVLDLPTEPVDGQEVVLAQTADVHWPLRYREADGRWHALGATPLVSPWYFKVVTTLPTTGWTEAESGLPTITLPRTGSYDLSYASSAWRALDGLGVQPDVRLKPALNGSGLATVGAGGGYPTQNFYNNLAHRVRANASGPGAVFSLRHLSNATPGPQITYYDTQLRAAPVWLQ